MVMECTHAWATKRACHGACMQPSVRACTETPTTPTNRAPTKSKVFACMVACMQHDCMRMHDVHAGHATKIQVCMHAVIFIDFLKNTLDPSMVPRYLVLVFILNLVL